jgi:FdhD protein
MIVKASIEPLRRTDDPTLQTSVDKVMGRTSRQMLDNLAIEEPLEIQLSYGPSDSRQTRSISVTMRTPGNDFELAVGFLMSEGVIRDANDIEQIMHAGQPFSESERSTQTMDALKLGSKQNVVRVELAADVEVGLATLQRNFYTTSSCGICGKASLVALRTVCPPRAKNNFRMHTQLL